MLVFRSPHELPCHEDKFSPLPSGAVRELKMILKELRVITEKIRAEEDSSTLESDWKFAAMVLDRLCLITFTLFTMLATAALLITAPHVSNDRTFQTLIEKMAHWRHLNKHCINSKIDSFYNAPILSSTVYQWH